MAGYLQSSGAISMSQINSVFDGRGNNLNAYRGTTWYTAAGGSGTFSSGAISFNDFYNKGPSAAITVSLASITNNQPFEALPYSPGEPSEALLDFLPDGTWNSFLTAGNSGAGNWATPTTGGIGASYWIRFTRTALNGGGALNPTTGSTGWLQLSITRNISVLRSSGPGVTSAQYTIEIATNSSGTNIVASAAFITVSALYQ